MNIKQVLAEFLKEEPRRSGRLEAIRFMRRYATETRPMTHYRLQGPAVDAVPLLLRKAGLEDGKDFKVEKSAASDRTAKLWWLDGSGVSTFMLACAIEAAPSDDGLTPFDYAYAKVLSGGTDDEIAGRVRDTTVAVDVGSTAAGGGDAPSTAETVRAQASTVRKTVVSYVESTYRDNLSGNVKVFSLGLHDAAGHEESRGMFMPSLATIEFYVRVCKGKTFVGGPNDLVFMPYTDVHTVVRPFGAGDVVPVGNALEAPLFLSLDGDDNPMHGYLSNRTSDVVKSADGKPALLALVNAPVACGSPVAANVVSAVEFAALRPKDFWEYVRWLYAEAFPGFGVELTRYHSIGYHNLGPAYQDWFVEGMDDIPMVDHVGRIDRTFMTMTAMFAVVIAPRIRRISFLGPTYKTPDVSVVRGTPVRPDLSSTRITDAELPYEWFAIAHCGGTVLAKGETWHRYMFSDSGRREQLESMRSWISSNLFHSRDVGHMCSVADNEYLHPGGSPDVMTFSTMSSLVSGTIAAIRHWNGDSEKVVIRDWGGEDQRNCHTKGVLVSAVYSGMWSEDSRGDLSSYSPGDSFPKLCGASVGDLVSDGSFRAGSQEPFTALVDRLSNRDTTEQFAVPPSTSGVRCSVVLETNVSSGEFISRLAGDPVAAGALVRKLQFLFVSSLLLRVDDPFAVLNGDPVPTQETYVKMIGDQLARDNVQNCCLGPTMTRPSVPDFADSCVSVCFREDVYGRVYVVFNLSSFGMLMARYMFRYHCGLPVAGCSEAEEAWISPDDDHVVYVDDEKSYDKAVEIIRKALKCVGTEGNVVRDGLELSPGASRPLVCPTFMGVGYNESPSRAWFLAGPASNYIPSVDVGVA